MLERLPEEIDRIITLLQNNTHFSDVAHILIAIPENEFIKSLNPKTQSRSNIRMEFFPEIAHLMNDLNDIIDDMEKAV